jgi:hypothetical protein
MKLFTQLALVTAIASCGSAYAMQSMDDSALSSTTGQDGITILIAPPLISTQDKTGYTAANGEVLGALTQKNAITIGAAVLHDKDGFAGNLGGGAIIIGDASQANSGNTAGVQLGIYGSSPIGVTIDASNGKVTTGLGGTKPILNIGVSLPTDLLIRTGDISVDGSARAGIATGAAAATVANAATGGTTGNAVKILNSLDIGLGGATLNIQLGNTQQSGITPGQTTMIKASGSIAGGLSIQNLGLIDANTFDPTVGQFGGGTLGVSTIVIKDHTSANLTLSAAVDVIADGSVIPGLGLPTGTGALVITTGGPASDIMLENVTLGSAGSTIGDLQLINVQAAGTHIFVAGH